MGRKHTIRNLRDFRPIARLVRTPPVLPLLSPEQELVGNGVGKLKQRLAPLHRRKSDAVDGRFRRISRNFSSAQKKTTSSGQEPNLARRRSTTPDASRPSTTSNTSTAREGVPSSRTSCSSEPATDPGTDQAQMKVSIEKLLLVPSHADTDVHCRPGCTRGSLRMTRLVPNHIAPPGLAAAKTPSHQTGLN